MTVGSFICSPWGLVQDHVAHFVAFFLLSAQFLSPCFRLLLVLFSVGLLLVLACELISTMGQTSSKSKPLLDLILSHFQDFRNAAAFSATCVKLGHLRVICSAEWPAFQAGWPPKGSLDLKLILRNQDMALTIRPSRPGPLHCGPMLSSGQPPLSWLKPHSIQHSIPEIWVETTPPSASNPAAPSHSCLRSKYTTGPGKVVSQDSRSQTRHH